MKDKLDRKIRPPLPTQSKLPTSPLSKTLDCRFCGEPYVANPPDDLHIANTSVREDVKYFATVIQIPYSCVSCGENNLLFWYNPNEKSDEQSVMNVVYSDTPDYQNKETRHWQRELHDEKLICRKCQSSEFRLAHIFVIRNMETFAGGDALICANISCHSILATVKCNANSIQVKEPDAFMIAKFTNEMIPHDE